MSIDLSVCNTIVFDCDGVILDSNTVKTEAFLTAAMPYGESAAAALVNHHVLNGGVSRYRKFAYFLNTILPKHAPDRIPGRDGPNLDEMLASYSESVRVGLMSCSVAEGLEPLRVATPQARWCIVSGGDEAELREIFAARGLCKYFDGGIFGSPDTKDTILARELATGCIRKPAVFLGDSCYDHQAAKRAGLDFIFISGWTEFSGWETYGYVNQLNVVRSLADLLSLGPAGRCTV
jgi:phosphoglycolate phosphatase-like HAD superfamily hydrolase